MAANSQKRYDSAGALASDLRMYLENRPVRARPIGVIERGARWVRRRPALSATLAIVVLLSWLAAFTYQRHSVTTAEQNEKLARAFFTVDALLISNAAGVNEDGSTRTRLRHPDQDPLLRQLFPPDRMDSHFLTVLRRLTREGDYDTSFSQAPDTLMHAVRARLRVGRAQYRLGNLNEAKVAYLYALELIDKIREDESGFAGDADRLVLPARLAARIYNDLADVADAELDFETALAHRRVVLAVLDEAMRSGDGGSLHWDMHERGRAHAGRGALHLEQLGLAGVWHELDPQANLLLDDADARLEHLDQAVNCILLYTAQENYRPGTVMPLADALLKRSELKRALGIVALDDLTQAVELLKKAVDEEPQSPDLRHAYAVALASGPVVEASPSEASLTRLRVRLERAYELSHSLSRSDSERAPYLETKVDICQKLAEVALLRGEHLEAKGHLREAMNTQRLLVERLPQRTRFRVNQGLLKWRASQFNAEMGKPEHADRLAARAHRNFELISITQSDHPHVAAARQVIEGKRPLRTIPSVDLLDSSTVSTLDRLDSQDFTRDRN